MEAHQERVITEKAELDEKIRKLNLFVKDNPTFLTLPKHERFRLMDQLDVMRRYSAILADRIADFVTVEEAK
jgi:hypothetical protein